MTVLRRPSLWDAALALLPLTALTPARPSFAQPTVLGINTACNSSFYSLPKIADGILIHGCDGGLSPARKGPVVHTPRGDISLAGKEWWHLSAKHGSKSKPRQLAGGTYALVLSARSPYRNRGCHVFGTLDRTPGSVTALTLLGKAGPVARARPYHEFQTKRLARGTYRVTVSPSTDCTWHLWVIRLGAAPGPVPNPPTPIVVPSTPTPSPVVDTPPTSPSPVVDTPPTDATPTPDVPY